MQKISSPTIQTITSATSTAHILSTDDGSISIMSDTTSRLIAIEEHFNQVTQTLQQWPEKQEKDQAE